MKKVLTIAGSDCSGGAGVQADIKTITAYKHYAMSVITSITAQNTKGVYGVYNICEEYISKQMDAIFTDIVPDSVKIGMVSSSEIINVLVNKLKEYSVTNIVLDPVMIATSGGKLLDEKAINDLIYKLMPLSRIITPNIPEAEFLSGKNIKNKMDMENTVKEISRRYKGYILLKGGHLKECSDDLLYDNGNLIWFNQRKIANENTHGSGCTLSSAIACGLANGLSVEDSISLAKDYITGALKSNLNIGEGNGPLNHCWNIK